MNNIYMPTLVRVSKIIPETYDIKTFQLEFLKAEDKESFHYEPGQFAEFSIFGSGEATFCLTSSPSRSEWLECSVKKTGKVTSAFHELWEGDVIGLRGPYGNCFPYSKLKGKNILFVGGGIGLAPLRSLLNFMLDNRPDYGKITLIYGAHTPEDLAYKKELHLWPMSPNFESRITVDKSDEKWEGQFGLVPTVLTELAPSAENTVAVICGPPIMIKFTVKALEELHFQPSDIITTLEMKMKCGLGKCGRCNIGKVYICQNGPVFSYAEILNLPDEF